MRTRRNLPLFDGAVSYLEWEGPRGAPLLVFLHANGFNAETYVSILGPLATQFRIIAPDLRGHGSTTLAADARLTGRGDKLMMRVASTKRRRAQFASHEEALKSYIGRGAFRTWPESMIADYLRGGLLPHGDG